MNSRVDTDEARVHRFGDCVLDVGRRTLLRGGQPVELQPKAFDLLVHLIENRDRAVDKDELQAAIWPRVVVTEASLTKAVQRARLAVGDDSDSQSVIRTVHGHGYRLVAELAGPEPQPASGAAPGPASGVGATGAPQQESWRWPVWLAVAALALAIGYGSFHFGARTAAPKPTTTPATTSTT